MYKDQRSKRVGWFAVISFLLVGFSTNGWALGAGGLNDLPQKFLNDGSSYSSSPLSKINPADFKSSSNDKIILAMNSDQGRSVPKSPGRAMPIPVPGGLSISPTSGTVGAAATISTGRNTFNSSERVRIDFGTIVTFTFVTADGYGEFDLGITIPEYSAGPVIVTATGLTSFATTTFTVTVPAAATLVISPITGMVGTLITATGGGFGNSEQVRIDFGTTRTIATANTNPAGSFTTTFTADAQTNPTVSVKTTGLTSAKNGTATFYLPNSLVIEPAATTTTSGSQITYSATAKSEKGGSWVVTGQTTFSTTDPLVTVLGGANVYTAGKIGSCQITGSYTSLAGTASVTVNQHGPAVSLDITPDTASVLAGATVIYTATATDGCNSWLVTGSTTFTHSPAGGAMATNVYTAGKIGTYTITGTYEGKTDTATVVVSRGPAVSLDITPDTASVLAGATVTYTATATDGCNSWPVTGSTIFTHSPAGGAMAANVYTAGKIGTYTITGTYEGKTDTATVVVSRGPAKYLDLSPLLANVWVQESVTYSATARDNQSNTWPVTGSTTFTTNDKYGVIARNVYTAGEAVRNGSTWTTTGVYRDPIYNITATGTAIAIAKEKPNLVIIKWGQDTVLAGDRMNYYIYYANRGCSQAANVTLKDTLPPGVSFVSSTLGNPSTSTGNVLTWNLGSLESQDTGYYATITVSVALDTVGSITNVVSITTTTVEFDYGDNRDTWTTIVKPREIDLSVSKQADREILQGQNLSYEIIYGNYGYINASSVKIIDNLPEGVSYVSNTAGTPIFSNGSKTLTWNIGNLGTQTSGIFKLTVRVDSAPGTITNVISISGTEKDFNPANNQASWKTVVKPSKVDLVISKQGPGVATIGQQIKYLISYRNDSQLTATGVTITDTLPSGVTYATSTLGAGNGTTTRIWSIGTLIAQASGYFELTVNVGSSTSGNIDNVVAITTSAQEDSNPANNRATATTLITAPVDLRISKSGPAEAKLNTNVSYTIQYQRLSGGNVTATITDTLPRDTKFATSTLGTPVVSGNRYSWPVNITDNAMQIATITVYVPGTVAIGTSLTNHVAIIPPDDSNWANNFATWTSTTDEAITDLELLKYGSWVAIPGGKLVYRFWLNNIGETDITGGTLTDTLPIGLSWATNTNQWTIGTPTITGKGPNPEHTDQSEPYTLIWTIKRTLPAGSCTMVEVLLDVCPAIRNYSTTRPASPTLGYSTEYINNNIQVETIPPDSNRDNNEDDFITQILSPGRADVAIWKSGPYESCPGQIIKYYISGGNYGYADAGGVTLKDTLPIGVTLQNIYCYPWGMNIGTNPTMATFTGWGNWKQQVLTWNIGTISATSGIYSTTFTDAQPNWFGLVITVKIDDNILPQGWTSINLDNFIEIKTASPEETGAGSYQNSMNFKTIVVPPQVDLVAYKYGPAECAPGEEIAYSISCYNMGPDRAHTVTITDTLPPGVEYATDTSGLPLKITGNPATGQKLVWTVGTLGTMYADDWRSYYKWFSLRVKVGTITVNTRLTNKIEISSVDKEKNPANNRYEYVTTVKSPAVDLTIKKYGQEKVIRGNNDDLWYWFWFSNEGNTTAKKVKIVDTLPSGVTYKKHYGGYGNWMSNFYQSMGTPIISPNNQIITWEIDELPPDSYGYISLLVTANLDNYHASQSVTNRVTISSQQPDSNPNNNYKDCKSHVVNPVTNLHVNKHGPKKVSPGKEMIYTIHYGNAGNVAARDIEIVDTFDKGVTYMGSDLDFKYPPQIIGDKVIWRIPKIRHGFNSSFDVRTLVAGSLSTQVLKNKVEITVLATDNNPRNNVSDWKTRVVEEKADIAVVITGDIARPGFKKNLYVTCSNEGTGKAENVVLTLKLPDKERVNYDYSYPQGNYNSSLNTLTWSVGSLPPGERRCFRAKIEVKSSVPRGTRLYSQAIGTTTSRDSDTTNNVANEREDVITSYDPNIKTASPQDYVPATATDITYTVHFENIGQAPATKIKIDDPLSDKLDWSTVAIGDVYFEGTVYTVSEFNTWLDNKIQDKYQSWIDQGFYTQEQVDQLKAMSGLMVWWHPDLGTITWEFDLGDPQCGLQPTNPIDESGHGWVRFTASTIGTLTSGAEITNQATIKFDYNDPMDTPVVKHIVDGAAPAATVTVAPYQIANTFTVSWAGSDDASGIASYEVYAAEDTGTPTLWASFVEPSAEYVGAVGHNYTFYCRATDKAGNVGGTSTGVTTSILASAPAPEAATLTAVIIDPASAEIVLGETKTLTAQGLAGIQTLDGVSYAWEIPAGLDVTGSSTNSRTVKAAGTGTRVVRVTATKNGSTATTTGTYTISVGAINQITIVGSPTSLEINQQACFVGHAYNKFLAEITGQTFAWEVKDTAVGSVTVPGTSTNVGTVAVVTGKVTGSGWVVAAAGGKEYNLPINVSPGNVATVTVTTLGPTTLVAGQSGTFSAKATNRFGYEFTDKTFVWQLAPEGLGDVTSVDFLSKLTAKSAGKGTLTVQVGAVSGGIAITTIPGSVTGLAIISAPQIVPAGMMSAPVVVQTQNEYSYPVNVLSTTTVTVNSDSLLSRFSQSATGANWTAGIATYSIPTGANSLSFYHKYNGTTAITLAISVNATGKTGATQTIAITGLGTTTSGDVLADDGKTKVGIKAGALKPGASFIEMIVSPADPGSSLPVSKGTVAGTLREINIYGPGLAGTATVTIPYTVGNLGGKNEMSLELYQLNGSKWEKVATQRVNTTDKTVSGVVSSFSYFVLMLPGLPPNLDNVIVYPNPCIPSQHGYEIVFANLTENSTIKIFNIAGELVDTIEVKAPPRATWNLENDFGTRVASGIYIYLITDPNGNKKIGKIGIIR